MKHWKTSLLAALLTGVTSPLALACVGCREPGSDVVAHESQTVAAGAAFSSSVVFMLIFVLLMASGLAGFIWKTCRRLDREQSQP